ncbi:MAG: hypothetical protein HC772_05635 [Leptolyngbyaceae cyanobacterium CRU_2_3]|nr:hypothetical protein [Leptolyngbyaceae cyanobacterium CRU_2_3]
MGFVTMGFVTIDNDALLYTLNVGSRFTVATGFELQTPYPILAAELPKDMTKMYPSY